MDSSHLLDWMFNGFAVIFLLIVICSFVFAKIAFRKAALAALLAVFCALFGNPDRFDTVKFSLGGVEAKAREVIRQAEVTIDQLQRLSTALAEGSLNELAFSGQVFVGMSASEKFRVRDQIIARLHEIGVKPDDILQAQQGWIYFYCDILEQQIERAVIKNLPNVDAKNEFDKLAKENGKGGLPSPDALRKWVAAKAVSDPELNELLQNYESVWTTGAAPNPDLIPFGSMPRPSGER
jgi:hypothetical protein